MHIRFLMLSWLVLSLSLLSATLTSQAFAVEPTVVTTSELLTSPTPVTSNPVNLTISPVTINLETKPGQSVTTTLKIRNNSAVTEKLVTKLGSFVADETGQKPLLIEPDPSEEFLQWLTVSEPSFEVQPNEWKTIKITFSPPDSAALSYYYTLYLQRETSINLQPGEARIEGWPAILILTTVISPQSRHELQLEKVGVKHPFLEFLPQEITLSIKNNGNVHTAPQGTIFIDGQGQKDIAVLPLNPDRYTVLPQSTRSFTVNWADGFPTHNLEQNGKLSWDFDQLKHFRFGKYTAHVVMVYDNGERDVPIESFVSFWVIPWKILLAGLAVIGFTAVGLTSTLKQLWKKIHSTRNSSNHT